jgi:hypothetical protein
MTIMLGKVYAALKAAGAPDDEAQAAAEELGDLHDQFGSLRDAMQDVRTDLKVELQGLRSDLRAEVADVRSELGELRNDFRLGLAKLQDGFRAELSESRNEYRSEAANLRSEVAHLRGRFDVLIWAVGVNAATTIAILGVLLRH